MSRVIIRPYKLYSRSAKLLQEKIKDAGYRCIRIRHDGNYRYRDSDIRINWGSSFAPSVYVGQEINRPDAVKTASNKIRTFRTWKDAGIETPEFWVPDSPDFYPDGNHPLVARTKLSGHSGQGVYVLDSREQMHDFGLENNDIKLWTKYVKKRYEVRCHVISGRVERTVRKMRRRDTDQEDSRVWSHGNGYIFVVNNHMIPQDILERGELFAIDAVKSCGLDFGAVDLIYNQHYDKWYALEVNTSPGLDNTTAEIYANSIINNI